MYLSPFLGKMSAAVRVGYRRVPNQLLNIMVAGITQTRNEIGVIRLEANNVTFEVRYVANMLPRTVGTVKNRASDFALLADATKESAPPLSRSELDVPAATYHSIPAPID